MAWLGNIHRDPKKGKPFTPADFDPFARRRRGSRVSVARLTDEIMAVAASRGFKPTPRPPAG